MSSSFLLLFLPLFPLPFLPLRPLPLHADVPLPHAAVDPAASSLLPLSSFASADSLFYEEANRSTKSRHSET